MRRRVVTIIMLLAVFLIASAGGTSPNRMTVQVREGMLRTAPSFLARPAGTLKYADPVDVLSNRNGWFQVRSVTGTPVTGWIHGSALTSKSIVLVAGAKNAELAARSDEVALAGKGFNESVEASYRETHQELDFTWVDRMETFTVAPRQILVFLEEGGVAGKGGAQ
ncbi:MAG: SH3 domain-containing protein [Pseudomonadota bacterium]